ncbi:MAG: IS200/IS605 family transposase, partial [Firmicutes bacterium HGW-Firmicutes-7]
INEISEEYGFSIMEVNADLDHIHIMIDCKPQH